MPCDEIHLNALRFHDRLGNIMVRETMAGE